MSGGPTSIKEAAIKALLEEVGPLVDQLSVVSDKINSKEMALSDEIRKFNENNIILITALQEIARNLKEAKESETKELIEEFRIMVVSTRKHDIISWKWITVGMLIGLIVGIVFNFVAK